MYTSLGLVALAGSFLTPSAVEVPSWRHNYDQARQEGQRQGKPLAVVLGSGPHGYNDLSEKGKLARVARQLLAEHYVPVYVDLATPDGQKLAEAFAISGGPGLILSDRGGRLQAFSHEGSLADGDLVSYLRRYADPNRVAETTEGTQSHISYYPPQDGLAPAPSYQPYVPVQSFAPASFGGGGGC